MANEKLISVISRIERAVGMIEGVSYGLSNYQASALIDAIKIIDGALEELKNEAADRCQCSDGGSYTVNRRREGFVSCRVHDY